MRTLPRLVAPSLVLLACAWPASPQVAAKPKAKATTTPQLTTLLHIGGSLLSVPLFPQETNSWCWAASGQMVMQYFGHAVPQCEQATYQFGQPSTNCCGSPTPALCISGGIVEIGHYGFTYSQLGGSSALSSTQIKDQISTRKTPWILNPNSPGFGHVTVGVGYLTLNGAVWLVAVNDPWPPNVGDFYYEDLASYQCGYWGGTCHTEGYDLYNIKPPKLKILKPPYAFEVPPWHLPPPELRLAREGDPDPARAAAAAWSVLQHVATRETAERLGLASAEVAAKARLGAPVEQFGVPLARLRAWKPGAADQLAEPLPGRFVPVEVDGQARAALRLRQQAGRWRLATFGSPHLAEAWQRARAAGAEFLVEIESLETAFAGRRVGGKPAWTPLFADARLRLEAGREQPAEKILEGLVEAAAGYRPSLLSKPR